ncbi:hypothetical protein B0H10DRAFT_1973276 [Mycena sp. CBHHK59/15]|nr:hypothetical protein B0H10DRAFT_1973276 [Mycena sp. CBHHK59/15]
MGLVMSFVRETMGKLATLAVFRWLFRKSRSVSPYRPPTLISLPGDILGIVFEILMEYEPAGLYDQERCMAAGLIPLSQTCRRMREHLMPWLYREVYNWSRMDGDVWPFLRIVHLRDHSVRNPRHISLNNDLCIALPTMTSLTKVTLRLVSHIPPDLLAALSLIPYLTILEIHQARFDGAARPGVLSFPSLEILLISICGFQGVVRASGIDRQKRRKIGGVRTLQISGDLLGVGFLQLKWPALHNFSITEHTPTPYISVPDLAAQMPALQQLSVLFSADLTRNHSEPYPPFTLGSCDGGNLTHRCPVLRSVTLSNLGPADPIFQQLPASLEALHLLSARDLYAPRPGAPKLLQDTPLTADDLPIVLNSISRLDTLVELTLTFYEFPTPAVIRDVASAMPQLRFLQLGRHFYSHGDVYIEDVRDDAIIDALRELPHLTHLRIALDFRYRQYNQEGPQESAARWLMAALPGLRIVEFCWEQWRSWQWVGLEPSTWQPWDRSVLLRPPTPPPSPPTPYHEPPDAVDMGWD